MNRSSLIAIIAAVLVGFILVKGAVSLVCHPTEKNSVANVISNVMPAQPNPQNAKPDPFSWDPVINSLVKLISKACPV